MLRKVIEITLELNSITSGDIESFEVEETIKNEMLDIKGVSEVSCYSTFIITCAPDGTTNETILADLERIQTEAHLLLKKYNALSAAAMLIDEKVREACAFRTCDGMLPSVFKVTRLDGVVHYGSNFQSAGTKIGDKFHYDHGVGIEKNTDAEVIWVWG